MQAKDLKNSILQLAVQGKLVPQNPNDEPASVLLEHIRAERAKLIKEKKIKKPKGGESVIYRGSDGSYYEKRGNGEPVCIDDELPFEIPDSWEWARLSTLSEVINGDRGKNYPAKSKLGHSGIPFVSALNIENGIVSENKMLYMTENQYVSLNAGKLRCNDIVFCIRGSLGKFGIFEGERGAIASSLVIVRSYLHENVLLNYLQLLFSSPLSTVQIKQYNNGTAQPNLSAKDFKSFVYPLPPLAEQQRIVEKVEQLTPLIEDYGKLEEAREQLDTELPDHLRKSVLQMAVEGKLVPQDPSDEPASVLLGRIRAERKKLIAEGKAKAPKGGESIIYRTSDGSYYEKRGNGEPVCIDDEIPFEIPDSWEWARLKQLCDFGKCTNIEYANVDVGTWNLDLEDLEKDTGKIIQKKRKHDGEKGSTKHVFRKGMVLYSKLRPYLNKVAIADEDGVCTSEILPLAFKGFSSAFAQLFLMSPYFIEYAKEHSYGVKMPRLGTADGVEVLVPIPPLAEQSRIVKKVQEYKRITNQ